MKWKRGIGVLMCCMTVMGAVSFGGLHTEAAACNHTYLQAEAEVYKESSFDSAGHYDVYGDKLSCPRCGYVRWENLHTKRTTGHTFEIIGTDIYGNPVYSNHCSFCPYTK